LLFLFSAFFPSQLQLIHGHGGDSDSVTDTHSNQVLLLELLDSAKAAR
jgi:hypothetical protein